MKAAIVIAMLAVWAGPVASQQIQDDQGVSERLRHAPSFHEKGRTWFDEVDGTLWARGDDFKASFSADGVSFVPFLGSDAPRSYPVTFRVERVSAGNADVPLAKPDHAVRDGAEITLDRGGMTEAYTVGATRIEQLFRFEKSPGGGDLVIRLLVETELAAASRSDGTLEFANERGGVRYGRPEAVDAAGRRAPMESSWHDGRIELRLPAAFAAEASFPLTVDPILLTFGLSAGGPVLQDFRPDAAYDLASDLYAVVYEEVYSASDHDVFVRTMNALGTTIATAYVDFTSSFWAAPKVANNRIAGQFLVVAEKTLSGGVTVIFGRTIVPTNPLTMGAQFQISGAELGYKSHPDVGGDPSPSSPTYYCVCWQATINSNTNVYYNLVTAGSTVIYNPAPFLGAGTANTNSKPSISKSDGNGNSVTQNWIVAYQRTYSANDEDIYASMIHWSGGIILDAIGVDGDGYYATDPAVSSVTDEVNGARQFLVVYQKLSPGNPPFSPPQYDLYGRLYNATVSNITSITGITNLTSLLGLSFLHDQTHGSVDCDGTRFTIGLTDSGGVVDLGTPYLATVHVANGTTLGVTEFPVSLNAYAGMDDDVRVTSKHSGGGVQYRYMAVHDVQSLVTSERDVDLTLYDGWSPAANGSYIHTVSPGCGGLHISVTGFPALGLGLNAVLTGVQGTGFVIVGAPIPPVALCSGCLLGVDPTAPLIIQSTNVTATVPLDGGLVNVGIAVQGADIGSSSGCSGSPSFSLSETVIVTIL